MTAVVFEGKGSIGHIVINRPEVLNALNSEVWQGIQDALISVRDDPKIRVVVLSGTGGKAFSVGADLKARSQHTRTSSVPIRSPLQMFYSLGITKPIVAAIDGYCLGAGFFLAMSCDVRFASEDSTFGIPEVTLAISPSMGVSQWLPRLIPGAIALKLLLTGEQFSARDAFRYGFITDVFPKNETMNMVEKLANRISENGPLAVQGIKAAFWAGIKDGPQKGLRVERDRCQITLRSHDVKEAMQAFAEKRKPIFKGE